MKFTHSELIELLVKTTKRIKRYKKTVRRLRAEKRVLEAKIDKIEWLLAGVNYNFTVYDNPSPREDFGRQGQVELKEELLEIIHRTS